MSQPVLELAKLALLAPLAVCVTGKPLFGKLSPADSGHERAFFKDSVSCKSLIRLTLLASEPRL